MTRVLLQKILVVLVTGALASDEKACNDGLVQVEAGGLQEQDETNFDEQIAAHIAPTLLQTKTSRRVMKPNNTQMRSRRTRTHDIRSILLTKPRKRRAKRRKATTQKGDVQMGGPDARNMQKAKPPMPDVLLRKGQRDSMTDVFYGRSLEATIFVSCCVVYALAFLFFVCSGGMGKAALAGPALRRADSALHESLPRIGFEEDTYCFATMAAINTTVDGGRFNYWRLARALLLAVVNMGLQVYFVLKIKQYVTPEAVTSIRLVYSKFEWEMYGRNMSHMVRKVWPDTMLLGKPQYLDPDAFRSLDPSLKRTVCHVPLSQPFFFVIVLSVWALTCMGELRKCLETTIWLFHILPTTTSIKDVLTRVEESVSVERLTMRLKLFILCFIVLPRVCVTVILLWLGCRWLAATTDFADLILNAVALEFVLLLKDVLFNVVASARSKHDLDSMEFCHGEGRPPWIIRHAWLWGIFAIAWSVIYTFCLQRVLPGYNWDVADACAEFLKQGFR